MPGTPSDPLSPDDPRPVLGVVGTSRKRDERRLPIHPAHLERLDEALRRRMVVETGYGEPFGVDDAALAPQVGRLAPRGRVIAEADVVLLPKPQLADVEEMRPGQVLWGWPHCVQDVALTQAAIDRRLTLIAFEAMNHPAADGGIGLHVFHQNNELAGYAAVLHAMTLTGVTGDYGRRLTGVVIGFGATARGAVTALRALGVHEVQVLTHREVAAVAAPIHAAQLLTFDHSVDERNPSRVMTPAGSVPLVDLLADHDVVVNCTLQDTDAPVTYLRSADLAAFRPGSLVVDVSCDLGMGFEWARPTSFAEPVLVVGDHVAYYAVDHTPSYLWGSATWELSEALLPFVPVVMAGPEAWARDRVLSRATEIRDGVVVNPKVLAFQHRSPAPPHAVLTPV